MVELARRLAPAADIRVGDLSRLPWPDASFDVVTAVNALQFADDTDDAVAEAARVTVPGGLVAVANWAESARNDLNTIERAVADAEAEAAQDGDLRAAGVLEALLTDGGLEVVTADLVAVPWQPADDDALIRGVLLGGDLADAEAVLRAAQQFRDDRGGYRLVNWFRFAVGRTPS